jgi:hypothetical protein
MARPYTSISDSFKTFKDNVNTVSFNVGDPDLLNTDQDSDLVGAINEIEAVFDASKTQIVSGSDFETFVTGDYTVDATADVVLDAGGGNLYIKDDSATRFQFIMGSNQEIDVPTGDLTVDVAGDIFLQTSNDVKVQLNGADAVTFSLGGASQTVTYVGGFTEFTTGNHTQTIGGAQTANVTGNITQSAGGNFTRNVDGNLTDSATGNHTLFVGGTSTTTVEDSSTTTVAGDYTVNVTGDFTVDASGDVVLDVDGADVVLKDAGTQYAALTNSGGHLFIKTGTDSALTFDATNATFSKTLYTDSALGTDAKSVAGGINELETAARGANADYALTTTAQNFRDAIREHETDIGNMTFTGLSATDISAAIRELRTELGDHTALDTETTTSAVAGINELHTDIGDISALDVSRDEDSSLAKATDLVTGLNYVDLRLDSVEALLDQAVLVASDVKFNSVETPLVKRTGSFTLDVSANINLDADGGSVVLKDGGTQYGALTADSSELIIKSGSTTAMTLSGANITFAGALTPPSLDTTATDIAAAINEHEADIGSMSLTTTATDLTAAINEHETDIGNMTFTGLSATDISAAIRELRTELGDHSSLSTDATSNVVAAVNEVDGNLDSVIASTIGTEDITSIASGNNTVKGALVQIHTEIGSLSSLDAYFSGFDTTHITALNALAADVEQLQDSAGAIDGRVGPLSALSAFFDSSGATSSIVSALNHTGRRVIDVYDASGTLLN